uniref:Uncharacterized protein n=1 Tax=Arundo donax TaxID=35708 RepID=A0A0A9IGM6_ARUDO
MSWRPGGGSTAGHPATTRSVGSCRRR